MYLSSLFFICLLKFFFVLSISRFLFQLAFQYGNLLGQIHNFFALFTHLGTVPEQHKQQKQNANYEHQGRRIVDSDKTGNGINRCRKYGKKQGDNSTDHPPKALLNRKLSFFYNVNDVDQQKNGQHNKINVFHLLRPPTFLMTIRTMV